MASLDQMFHKAIKSQWFQINSEPKSTLIYLGDVINIVFIAISILNFEILIFTRPELHTYYLFSSFEYWLHTNPNGRNFPVYLISPTKMIAFSERKYQCWKHFIYKAEYEIAFLKELEIPSSTTRVGVTAIY